MTLLTFAATGPPAAPPALLEARGAVRPALQRALQRLDPTSRSLAAYHLGWTDADGRPDHGNGGKALRPALALLSARAAGAPPQVGLPGAVAVELVHNFSLLHDDLMDGDRERRHRPTVWARWGPASAILTGDALLTLAQQVLLDAPQPYGPAAARLVADATQALVRGQVEDLAFEQRDDVTLEQCLAMADGKTGALLSASAAVGAVLAGAPAATVRSLSDYGHQLGMAFQLIDDLLGIWGSPEVTGKPVLSDLRARKKTLPVTFVLEQEDAAGRELADWLSGMAESDDRTLRHVADVLETAGARDWTLGRARSCLAAAEQALSLVELPADVHEQLSQLGRFVVERDC